MKISSAYFLWLILPFMLGIMSANYFPLYLEIHIVLVFLFTALYFLFHKYRFNMRAVIQAFPILLFFEFGYILYGLSLSSEATFGVDHYVLPGNKYLIEIDDISDGKGVYRKAEVLVHEVIDYRDTIPVKGKLLVFFEDANQQLKRKDLCYISGEITKVVNSNNPGEFNSVSFWKHKGINYMVFLNEGQFIQVGTSNWKIMDPFITMRDFFAKVLDNFTTGQENAVAKGLILGDRSSIDSEITQQFGNTGAMHVLAVSGLHVAILIQILLVVLGFFSKWISKNQALIIGLIVVWVYSAMTGFSPSVARSAVMFTIISGGTLLNKNYNGLNGLAFSAFLLLVWNPHFLFDIGFELSYLAMLGIFLFNQSLSRIVYFDNWILRNAWEGSMVGIAAQIMTVPLTLYYFHQFPNYFILTNLALMIFSFLVLALGIALFSFYWLPYINGVLAFCLQFTMFVMLWIIAFVDGIPGAVSSGFVLNTSEVVFLFGFILLVYWSLKQHSFRFLLAGLSCLLIWVIFLVNDRWTRMSQTQLCFFKENTTVFLVKQDQQAFCFYANYKNDPKRAKYLAEAYSKVYPAKIDYFSLVDSDSTSIVQGKFKLAVIAKQGGYQVVINGRSYYLAYSSNFEWNTTDPLIVLPSLTDRRTSYHLDKGAVIFNL